MAYEPKGEYVEVKPLRERFLLLQKRDGLTANEVAAHCGWLRSDTGGPDSTRVRRALGLKESIARGGETRRRAQEHIRYETAVLLAEALHMDPFEAGV